MMRIARGIAVLVAFVFASAVSAKQFYVAPSGPMPRLSDPALWDQVRATLAHEDAEVILAIGKYPISPTVLLDKINPGPHRLTIRGQHPDYVTIQEDPADKNETNFLLDIRDSKNVTLRDLHFETPGHIGGATIIRDCQDVTIEHCTWHDLPGANYSALSIIGETTRHVRVDHCDFRRVGIDAHAHMIYAATGPRFINVTQSHFEDCAGEYVRFRNQTDYCVVWDSDFVSTGTYKKNQPPMVSSPLFNDDDPNAVKPKPAATQEYFGTHYLIAHNRFHYAEDLKADKETRWAFYFHHSGYDPPGRQHLLTPAEAEELSHASAERRKQMLLQRANIDMSEVHEFDNVYENVDRKCAFRTYATYGAKTKGFSGSIDLSDLINESPVVKTEAEALDFYKQ